MKTIISITGILLFFISVSNAKVIYLEPVHNAKYVSILNNIIIGFDGKIESSNLSSLISVIGNKSGIHSGEIILASDGKKLIFKPDKQFAFGEQVEVILNGLKTSSASDNKLSYTFQTQFSKPETDFTGIMENELNYLPQNNFSNSKDFAVLPQLIVTAFNNPSGGDLYLSNFIFSVNPYDKFLITADNRGTITYSKPVNTRTTDFRKQPNDLLTYYTGTKYYADDFQHNLVDSFECGNGYTTDNHELRIDENGHAFLISYDPEIVDMSQVVPGGNPNATVYGIIIQEIDADKNVVFQWRSWDHFAITDATHENLTAAIVDYVHTNAIEIDNDGALMISSRHLSEITKISRETGDIIWRMGGIHNEFTFINDAIGFSYQHYIRRIPNGNITLYDNGNFHSPQFSRAVEYQLDEVKKTATLVWQYRHTPYDIYGSAMGSAQRLLNGNTLISWGISFTTMTEVTPAGNIALEMNLPFFVYTYRTFRDETAITLLNKIVLEGFYNTENDRLNMADTVVSYLRKIDSPYVIVDSAKSVLDSINFNGNFRFYNASSGTYYISVKHRNSIETWSKSGGEFLQRGLGNTEYYNFTESDTKAFGNNLVLKGSKYCIYGGDANQDGVVDVLDLGLADNGTFNFETGYLNTDFDGNNVVDAADLAIVENNAFLLIAKMTPP